MGALIFSSGVLMGHDRDFGVGIILGEPTGISFKFWTGTNSAFDAATAWSIGNKKVFHLHMDYLRHSFGFTDVEKGKLPFYYGIGTRIKFEKDTRVGIRFPLGLEYIFEKAPLDIFLEVVPLLNLIPSTDFDINASIGFRYYF